MSQTATDRFQLPVALCTVVCALALAVSRPGVQAQTTTPGQTFTINIPPQTLATALRELSQQTGVQIFAAGEFVADKRAPAVTGRMTPRSALELLLAGSGLRAVASGHDLLVQAPAQQPPAPSPADPQTQAITLPQVTVQDSREAGYIANHATTATRTDTPLFDLPVSIQVVPREVLDDRQVILFQAALENISGVVPSYGGGDLSDTATIRGFAIRSYRDGFRGRFFGRFSTSTADLERIEVLKGPASILYGQLEPGGFINQVSKQPLTTPAYSLQQQFGSFRLYRTTLDATGPLTANQALLYRLNFEYLNSGSFREFGQAESVFIAPSLTWDVSDRARLNVSLRYFDGERSSDRGLVALSDRVAPIPFSRNLGEPWAISTWQDLETSATLTYEVATDWTLRLRFAAEVFEGHFLDVDFFDGLLPDNRTLQRSVFDSPEDSVTYYTALELSGRFDTWGIKHTVLGGVDYYFLDGAAPFGFASLPSIDIFTPVHGAPRPRATFTPFTFRTTFYGVYIQDQLTLRDNLHLLLGARYDRAIQESQFATEPRSKTDDEAVSPRVGLVYQPLPWLALYGSYVESFGAANAERSRSGEPFDPETATQYEAGVKINGLEGRLTATLAFYHLTKQNVLTADPVDANFSVQTGEARSRGVELDVAGELLPGWSLIATYAYTDAAITEDNSGRQGFRLEDVPRHSGSLWNRFRFQHGSLQGVSLGAGVFAVGERTGFENDFKVPAYARVDLLAAYTRQFGPARFTAQLNIENLFDEQYVANAFGRTQILPGAPRTFLGSLRMQF